MVENKIDDLLRKNANKMEGIRGEKGKLSFWKKKDVRDKISYFWIIYTPPQAGMANFNSRFNNSELN